MTANITCSRCKKIFPKKNYGRFLNFVLSLKEDYNLCPKCAMENCTDRDRTGRTSKKDKFKSKEKRVHYY